MRIIGRIYPAGGDGAHPRPKYLHARSDPRRPELKRYVILDGEFVGHRRQPYTHSVEVSTRFRERTYNCMVFFKRHTSLPINNSTPELAEAGVRGDILVVVLGPRVGIRSIAGKETRVADDIVKKYVLNDDFDAHLSYSTYRRSIPFLVIPTTRRVPKYWPRRRRAQR